MWKYKFATGRTYDVPQVLEIEVLESTTDEYGFIDGLALFVDRSRHISGCVNFFAKSNGAQDVGDAVLSAYDSGDYRAKIFNHCA